MDFVHSASSLKQESVGEFVVPLGLFILIPTKSVFVLSHSCCALSSVATKANYIVFGLTLPAIEPIVYRTESGTITISPPMRLYYLL